MSVTWGPSAAVPPPPPPRQPTGCLQMVLIGFGCSVAFFVTLGVAAAGGAPGGLLVLLFLVAPVPMGFWGYRRYRSGRPVPRILWIGAIIFSWPAAVGMLIGRAVAASEAGRRHPAWSQQQAGPLLPYALAAAPDPYLAVRQAAADHRGGAFVGFDIATAAYMDVSPRVACLVIGPPGEGKTTNVIAQTVLVAPGAVVSSSVKTDVLELTWKARALIGRVWLLDPSGEAVVPEGVTVVRWSPVVVATTWDRAVRVTDSMANVMVSQGALGDGAHFVDRAKHLVAPLLYAARLGGRDIGEMSDWLLRIGDRDTAKEVMQLLIQAASGGDAGASLAASVLESVLDTADRERSSIISTAIRITSVYLTEGGRATGKAPTFDVDKFARSGDTLYIATPADRQATMGPLIVAFLESIRYAQYDLHAEVLAGREPKRPHMTWALDEIANTAPIPLPAIASEAGGQGLHLVAALQDLSQAHVRWGAAAKGFLTLFKANVILSSVKDAETLETISKSLGEYDRLHVSYSHQQAPGQWGWLTPIDSYGTSHSIQRTRVLEPGQIAALPKGTALLLDGTDWRLVKTTPTFAEPPWPAVLARAAQLYDQHKHQLAGAKPAAPIILPRQAPAPIDLSKSKTDPKEPSA
jgi:type IV secretion system protein VirD4